MGVSALIGFSGLLSSVTQGGEAAAIFTDAAELPDELVDAVQWFPDAQDLPRPMEPLTRRDVTSSWIRAWSQLTLAAETGDTSGVEVYFSNSAREAVLSDVENLSTRPLHQFSHELQVTFYSEDGQVLGLTATTGVVREEPFADGQPRFFETTETFESVLVLEDGNWRIHHWVRVAVDGQWLVGAPPSSTTDLLAESEDAQQLGELRVAGLSAAETSVGIPAEADAIDQALDVLATAQPASPVRVPVALAASGGGTLSGESVDALELVLERATREGVQIIVSLYDGLVVPDEIGPSTWFAHRQHLAAIETAVGGHEALAAIELTNGVDAPDSQLFSAWLIGLSEAIEVSGPLVVGSAPEPSGTPWLAALILLALAATAVMSVVGFRRFTQRGDASISEVSNLARMDEIDGSENQDDPDNFGEVDAA